MIIARSPLRISLGGGGTDLPSYYEQHTGFLVAAGILAGIKFIADDLLGSNKRGGGRRRSSNRRSTPTSSPPRSSVIVTAITSAVDACASLATRQKRQTLPDQEWQPVLRMFNKNATA